MLLARKPLLLRSFLAFLLCSSYLLLPSCSLQVLLGSVVAVSLLGCRHLRSVLVLTRHCSRMGTSLLVRMCFCSIYEVANETLRSFYSLFLYPPFLLLCGFLPCFHSPFYCTPLTTLALVGRTFAYTLRLWLLLPSFLCLFLSWMFPTMLPSFSVLVHFLCFLSLPCFVASVLVACFFLFSCVLLWFYYTHNNYITTVKY